MAVNEEALTFSLLLKVLLFPVVAAFVAWLGGRVIRNVKQNRKENAVDDGTVDILEHYKKLSTEERARADRAYSERNQAYEELGSLRSQVRLLTDQVARLEEVVVSYRGQLEHYQQRIETLLAERGAVPYGL